LALEKADLMLNDGPRSFDELQVDDKKGEQEYLPV